jgi:SNF2 family DNA or RNA helicase
MGCGKSLAAVAITGRLYLDGHIKRVLVVAPSSVCPVWPAEYAKFADFPHRVKMLLGTKDKRLKALKALTAPVVAGATDPLRVAVINYESTWRLEDELAAFAPDMIICDESQRIKGHTAAQSKAMHRLGDAAKFKLTLTGTPMQQDVRDIWSQYRFLAPDVFGRNFYAFQNRFCVFGGYGNHQYLGPRNIDELTRKMHSIALRVRKKDCLDLPEKSFEDHPVLLEDDAAKLYERIRKESYAELESGGTVTPNIVLTKLLRLQQIVGGFLTDDDGKSHAVSTAKLGAATELIETLCVDECRKLVIFCRYTAEYDALMARANKALSDLGPYEHVVGIRGGVDAVTRGRIVEQFQNNPGVRVFIGNIQACAEGLTLTAADTMLYYSIGWSLGQYLQSQDRIHRIGQRNACTYINLVVPGTVDEKVLAALHRKDDLAKKVVDNWRDLLG